MLRPKVGEKLMLKVNALDWNAFLRKRDAVRSFKIHGDGFIAIGLPTGRFESGRSVELKIVSVSGGN